MSKPKYIKLDCNWREDEKFDELRKISNRETELFWPQACIAMAMNHGSFNLDDPKQMDQAKKLFRTNEVKIRGYFDVYAKVGLIDAGVYARARRAQSTRALRDAKTVKDAYQIQSDRRQKREDFKLAQQAASKQRGKNSGATMLGDVISTMHPTQIFPSN